MCLACARAWLVIADATQWALSKCRDSRRQPEWLPATFGDHLTGMFPQLREPPYGIEP
jgi:hypothetical protein